MIAYRYISKNRWKTLSFVLIILLSLCCVNWVKRNVTLKQPNFIEAYDDMIKSKIYFAVMCSKWGLARDDYDKSRKYFEDAQTAAYESVAGVLLLSSINAAKNGDFVEAELLIIEANDLWLKNVELTMLRLLCHLKTGNYEEHVVNIRKAIELQSPRSAYFDAMVSAVEGKPFEHGQLKSLREIEYVRLLKDISAIEPTAFRMTEGPD